MLLFESNRRPTRLLHYVVFGESVYSASMGVFLYALMLFMVKT